jgi:hypothetical protein
MRWLVGESVVAQMGTTGITGVPRASQSSANGPFGPSEAAYIAANGAFEIPSGVVNITSRDMPTLSFVSNKASLQLPES